MFERIAELVIRRSRLVLVVAALAVALMGVAGAGAFGKLLGGGYDDPASSSTRAGIGRYGISEGGPGPVTRTGAPTASPYVNNSSEV